MALGDFSEAQGTVHGPTGHFGNTSGATALAYSTKIPASRTPHVEHSKEGIDIRVFFLKLGHELNLQFLDQGSQESWFFVGNSSFFFHATPSHGWIAPSRPSLPLFWTWPSFQQPKLPAHRIVRASDLLEHIPVPSQNVLLGGAPPSKLV